MENSHVEQDQDEIIIKCDLEEIAKAFFKDYEIIWHDPNVNSQENQQYLTQLEALCPVQTFSEWKEAENYIKKAKTVCHVITLGTNRELLVKEIFSNPEELVEMAPAIIFIEIGLACICPNFNDWDKSQMNRLHHYLKVIPNFNNCAEARKDFVDLSKKIYLGQRISEKAIEEFEDNYKHCAETILKWYTRPSFLHKVINNALRIATSDSIQYCRFVLKDLEIAIKDQYQKKSKDFSGLLYRGAYLSEEEWSSLKTNVNREIEMHGFLSASKDQNIARKFMGDGLKKIFITIIVPKGPNEEEQGFAEVEEFSHVPKEKEILFNVRSRFTVLEVEDKYSEDLPYRHLVLLYGAQGLRKFITEKNPVQQISIENIENILCSHCKISTDEMAEKWVFMSIVDPEKQIYFCRNCLEKSAVPFLSISLAEKVSSTIEIKGCLLTNSSQTEIPLYGYRCSKCGAKNQERYFTCTDCGERGKRWCESCFGKTLGCTEKRHAIILESSPFSFWCKKMSENELNHLRFQNDLVVKNNHLFQQAKMYDETHEYEKAIEFYNRYIVPNKSKRRDYKLAFAYDGLGGIYFNQGEYPKAVEYHLKSLDIRKSVHGELHPDVAASYNNIGMIYGEQGEYTKAFEYHLKSLEISKSIYRENHSNTAISYSNIGVLYDRQGEHMTALEHHLKCLDIMKSVNGKNLPAVAGSYRNIGLIYHKQGKHIKALEYQSKSLDIFKSIYGENHPAVSTSYNNIGLLYSSQGEYTKAFEYQLKSLEISKSIYGENHPAVSASYANIGSLYSSQGEYTKAFEYQSKSLEISKSIYGENHPDVAGSYHNIGLTYRKQEEYLKALVYFLKSLEIRKSFYGKNHPDVADSLCNIGLTYRKQGERMKAPEYHLKSLEAYQSVYGENHSTVATSFRSIGLIYDEQGEHIKALEYYSKSLDIFRSVYGEDHPEVAASYSSIGLVYSKQGEHMKALEYFWKSLEIFKSVYGENHPDVASSFNNIGLAFDEQGEHIKALEYHLKSLEIFKSVYGEDHPDVAASYYNIGLTYDEQGENMKALEYHSKSLHIRKLVHGKNHHDVAASYNNIGLVYGKQGEHMKALKYFWKSLKIKKSVYGENHLDVAGSYHNIGLTYGEQGEYMKAYEYHSKSMDIYKSLLGENHALLAAFYHSIGLTFYKQGEHMMALEYVLNCLEIYNSTHGENHPETIELCHIIYKIAATIPNFPFD